MKYKIVTSIFLLVCLIISDYAYGNDIRETTTQTVKTKSKETSAEKTLKDFLRLRSAGQYDKCALFLTEEYNNKFQQENRYSFLVYLTTSEMHFNKPRIQSVSTNDGAVVINVISTVEGDGYVSEGFETYYMILKEGKWKINGWKIEYKETKNVTH